MTIAAVKRSDGLPQDAAVLVVYDRTSGVFWWKIVLLGLNETRSDGIARVSEDLADSIRVYAGGGRMVVFGSAATVFTASECNDRAASLDDAEPKALIQGRAYLRSGRGDLCTGTKEIHPQAVVDPSLLGDPLSAAMYAVVFVGSKGMK